MEPILSTGQVLSTVVQLVAAIICGVILFLVRKYGKGKLDQQDMETLNSLILDFVQAAEQMFKSKDPTGQLRMGYVKKLLVQLGYELTDIITAKIESAVFRVNQEVKDGNKTTVLNEK